MTDISEHLVAWLKLPDVSANGFNPSGNVGAESAVFGFEQTCTHQAHQEYVRRQ